VTILFEVKIGNSRNAMSLCIPYLVLKPITSKLSAQKWFTSSSRKQSPQTRRMISYNLNQTKVNCTVKLGETNIDIRRFLQMRPGDIIRLDRRTDEHLTMHVGAVPKYRGKPALQGKKLVFAVSEIIEELP
jgi:flagellar motor switch protein FliM